MTPLREAFIRELVLRGTAARTQESYVAGVYHLARHYHVAPDAVTEAQLREYLLYLIQQRQLAPSSVNLAVCALRAFYQWVLHRDLAVLREALPRMIRQIHRPRVYSPQEIERLLTVGATAGKPRAFLMTVYGAGLRLNEACHLQVQDLDGQRHQIRVVQGKNHKDRYTLLSPRLLEELRAWQARILRALCACRTPALGGHRYICEQCGAEHFVPHACRNRHCPACQGDAAHQWLARQEACLLPVPYFHLVFTLPHDLNPLIQQNLAPLLNLLFAAVSATLLQFGHQRLGATLGLTVVLHTWGQKLIDHYHLHVLVTGGGLAPEGIRWVPTTQFYLFPVRALGRVFRAKFGEGLQRLFAAGQLQFHGQLAPLALEARFQALIRQATRHPWNVYARRPFAGPARNLRSPPSTIRPPHPTTTVRIVPTAARTPWSWSRSCTRPRPLGRRTPPDPLMSSTRSSAVPARTFDAVSFRALAHDLHPGFGCPNTPHTNPATLDHPPGNFRLPSATDVLPCNRAARPRLSGHGQPSQAYFPIVR